MSGTSKPTKVTISLGEGRTQTFPVTGVFERSETAKIPRINDNYTQGKPQSVPVRLDARRKKKG